MVKEVLKMVNQEAKEMITKCKIHLQKRAPFFAYLLLNLNYIEKKEIPTMAVDNHNNLYYNPDWVKGLSEDEVSGVITHEVCHIIFNHLIRVESRDALLFNFACDSVVNDILVANNFKLPKGGLIPNNDHSIQFCDIEIKDLDKKSAEVVYDEIISKLKKTKQNIQVISESGFDEHITDDLKNGKDSKGNPLNEKQIKEIKDNINKWKRLLVESASYAKMIGQVPNGLDRHIGEILNEKINWRNLLYRFITNSLAIDYSWSKPNKRSISVGTYLPYIKKENLEVVVAIDTSGSVGQEEYTEFISEIINLSKSFVNLKMKVIICDCVVSDVMDIDNGNIQKLLDLNIRGFGGTDHRPVYDLIENEYPSTKLLINFSDGFTSFPNNETIKTLWVLPKNNNKDNIPFGEIIEI